MMKDLKSTAALLLSFSLILLSVFVGAQNRTRPDTVAFSAETLESHHRPNPQKELRTLARYLRLDEEQVNDFVLLREALEADLQPLREQMNQLESELRQALETGDASASEVGTIVLDIHGLSQTKQELKVMLTDDFLLLLDEEQVHRFERLGRIARFVDPLQAAHRLGLHPAAPGRDE